MRRLSASAAGPLAVLALCAAGCQGHGTTVANADCAAGFAAGEGAAAVTPGAAGTFDLDFGPLLLGQGQAQEILISNVGVAPLHVLSVEPPAVESGFEVALSSPEPLQPGAAPLSLTVRFHPTAAGPTSADVTVVTDCPAGTLSLTLRGDGYQPLLVLDPPALDFGRVLLGSEVGRDLRVTNDSDAARALTLFPLQSADSSLFRLSSAPPSTLQAHEQITLRVVFRPAEAARLPSRSRLAVALDCTGCEASVDLAGQGVLTGLSVTPNPLDLGSVLPPGSATASLVLENVANAPITLLADPWLVQTPPDVFQLGSPMPGIHTVLQPGAKVLVPVDFTAPAIGSYQATLMLTTNDPYQQNVAVPIVATGGGPRIQCTPDAIDFGEVGVGIPSVARVTCVNVGVGNQNDPTTNLYFDVATDTADFSAAFDAPLPPDGLWPGPLSKAVIDVAFQPASAKSIQGNLILTSNDATAPVLSIPLQGLGISLPPCVFSVQPALLDFGQVARGLSHDATFVIADTGTVDCLLNGIDLSTGSNDAFSLPGGRVSSQRLSPVGSSSGSPSEVTVDVRFTPPLDHSTRYTPGVDSSSFDGQVQFTISDPNAPKQYVSLAGLSPDDCLVFDPVTAELGSVPYDATHQRWCAATRTLNVTNVCDQDATVTAASFDGGSGVFSIIGPGGGPGPWTVPPLISTGTPPVPFQITFRPLAAGQQYATLEVASSQQFPNQTISGFECGYGYLELSVKASTREVGSGNGQADGGQVDSFLGRGTQVDLLWIVDVTNPVGWQFAASDLAAFFQYPLANGIDFQMAVTSTSAVGAAPAPFVVQDFGYLEPCDHCWIDGGAATLVVPGTQPDPTTVLASLMSIGGLPPQQLYDVGCPGFDDQFFESFSEVLQPDLLAGHNAGFLRTNSVLAVIGLGDDDNDESVGSFSFFFNFLAGIRGRDRVTFSFAADPSKYPYSPYEQHNQLPGLMVQLTGGVNIDASQPGWMGQLAQVWDRIADQLLTYPLSSLPADPNPYDAAAHPGGLQVKVAGQIVPSAGWHYDAGRNAVIFVPSAAPPAGASLTVGYALGCGG